MNKPGTVKFSGISGNRYQFAAYPVPRKESVHVGIPRAMSTCVLGQIVAIGAYEN